MKKEEKKPVVFVGGNSQKKGSFYSQNAYAQNLLLKALSQGITDPEELRKAAGLKRVAEVYRTLDKIAIRKEYHDALARNEIDLDFITKGLKELAEDSTDKIKLGSLNSLLKSLGLDKYEKQEETGKSWEEEIIKVSKVKDDVIDGEIVEDDIEKYEVIVPEIPKEEMERQQEEKRIGKELYGD
jgi:hypothetical protein